MLDRGARLERWTTLPAQQEAEPDARAFGNIRCARRLTRAALLSHSIVLRELMGDFSTIEPVIERDPWDFGIKGPDPDC